MLECDSYSWCSHVVFHAFASILPIEHRCVQAVRDVHFLSGLADDASARMLDFEMVNNVGVQLWLIYFFASLGFFVEMFSRHILNANYVLKGGRQ